MYTPETDENRYVRTALQQPNTKDRFRYSGTTYNGQEMTHDNLYAKPVLRMWEVNVGLNNCDPTEPRKKESILSTTEHRMVIHQRNDESYGNHVSMEAAAKCRPYPNKSARRPLPS
jgi:hypothetical protein